MTRGLFGSEQRRFYQASSSVPKDTRKVGGRGKSRAFVRFVYKMFPENGVLFSK